jgi:hypothetical protein
MVFFMVNSTKKVGFVEMLPGPCGAPPRHGRESPMPASVDPLSAGPPSATGRGYFGSVRASAGCFGVGLIEVLVFSRRVGLNVQ